MKKQLLIIGIILVLFTVGLSGCFGQATKEFNNEYESDENTILQITNINGPITITQWNGNTVVVDATLRSNIGESELDNIEIEVTENNNLINIVTNYLGSGSVQVSTDMNINAATYVTIDSVKTSNGDIKISGTKGDIIATSSNGAIYIDNVQGYVTATTSIGHIQITKTTGVKDITSSNMGINVEVFDYQKNITISTSNGEISVYINPSLNANIEMKTSNGQISIHDVTLNLTTLEEKHVIGELGNGGNKIDIHTSNGNINLRKLKI